MQTNIPLVGNFKVTCEYGRKNSGNLTWIAGYHTGIDLVGDDQIYATCNGKVTRIGRNDKDYGNFIVIQDTENGKYHWFCHLSSIGVTLNQKVSRVSKIGLIGATGNVTAKHLHYEIRNASNKYADNINPAEYMGIENKVGSYHSDDYQLEKKYEIGRYKVNTDILTVRRTPEILDHNWLKYSELTQNAQEQVAKLNPSKPNGLVRGVICDISEIKGVWGKCPSGWISLEYCIKQ